MKAACCICGKQTIHELSRKKAYCSPECYGFNKVQKLKKRLGRPQRGISLPDDDYAKLKALAAYMGVTVGNAITLLMADVEIPAFKGITRKIEDVEAASIIYGKERIPSKQVIPYRKAVAGAVVEGPLPGSNWEVKE